MSLGFARIVFLTASLFALNCPLSLANAGECPGNPDALGTSRTIVVDPREHSRIGTMSYSETLPLADREVVLTFDDGPNPRYTPRVLDILAAECIHATYFIIGEMAKEYPALVRRVYDAGHTVGTHSMTHPHRFRALSAELGNAQIDNGIAAVAAALGDPGKVAPFFRFPDFGFTDAAHQHAAELGLMVWGADVPADDWYRLGAKEVARRAVQRLEGRGRGILLLHDIHERTVEALPAILAELKERGFRIVHVVPSSAERPATATAAADWVPPWQESPAARTVPIFQLANLQEAEGDLTKDNADELCKLPPPRKLAAAKKVDDDKPTTRRMARANAREKSAHGRHRLSRHAKVRPSHHAKAKAKPARQAKTKPAKLASAKTATAD